MPENIKKCAGTHYFSYRYQLIFLNLKIAISSFIRYY